MILSQGCVVMAGYELCIYAHSLPVRGCRRGRSAQHPGGLNTIPSPPISLFLCPSLSISSLLLSNWLLCQYRVNSIDADF